MKSIRLTRKKRHQIRANARQHLEESLIILTNTKEDIYKRLALADMKARMASALEVIHLHGLEEDVSYRTSGYIRYIHLAHASSVPVSELDFNIPLSFDFLAPYATGGDFAKEFNNKYELLYRPMAEQASANIEKQQQDIVNRLTALDKLLEKHNTTAQLEVVWKEAPNFYTSEMKQEIGS